MPARQITIPRDIPAGLVDGLRRLRAELDVPAEFPDKVLRAAEHAADKGPPVDRVQQDLTQVDFVTIDPPGSMDLDQALFIERVGQGYRVWYAIADVAAWVQPGAPIDDEAHRRGQTFYAPNQRIPLHPPALSERAASLLADGAARPALVWQIALDADGHQQSATVAPALVRNRQKLTYAEVQADLDAGTASESLQLLREVGLKRETIEAERGGVSLSIPEQEVHTDGADWTLEFRSPLLVEGWNAQISLLTGMAAAAMMLDGEVGILRTLPSAEQYSTDRLRHVAKGLKIAWPGSVSYPDFIRNLDPTEPSHQAMMNAATLLFRGAGYTVITPGKDNSDLVHGAIAANYAHTTAPLRRLVDRYVGEVCVNLCAGTPVPTWVRDALPDLPDEMTKSDRRANKFERGVVDLVEALVLSGRVGEIFTGTVVDLDERDGDGVVLLTEPAVEGPIRGKGLELGTDVEAKLTRVDVKRGRVRFALV